MESRRKGFTLLELQIVIVVIVLLAVIIVPRMLTPIEKARQEEHIAKARLAYLACQIIATEEVVKGTSKADIQQLLKDIDIGGNLGNSRLDILLGEDMKGSYVEGSMNDYGKVAKVEYMDSERQYRVILDNIDTGKGKIYVYDLTKESSKEVNGEQTAN